MAVDGYGWLHKGAYTCSTDLCLKRPTDKFVTFFLHRLQVLINHGLVPTIVFDGGQLPMKREENESRRSSRKQNYDKAMSLWKVGKQVAAEEYFQRAVHIGPDHAKQVIDALKLKGVHYIVAPYEADSQMAFLAQSGRVDLVITEDSDLLAYSCPEVLFKLDKEGNVQHVCFDELIKSSKFAGFTKLMFTEMCILSGCDFLQSVPGIGMKRAYTFIKKLRSHSAVIKRLKYSGFKVPSTYELDFRCALKVFHHQTVWDPLAAQLRHLTPLGEDMAAAQEAATDEAADGGSFSTAPASHLDFLGPHYSDALAYRVAAGDIHPSTFEAFRVTCSEQPSSTVRATSQRNSFEPVVKSNGRIASFSKLQNLRRPNIVPKKGRLSNYFSSVPAVCAQAKQNFVSPRPVSTSSIRQVGVKLGKKSDGVDHFSRVVNAYHQTEARRFSSTGPGNKVSTKGSDAAGKGQRTISKYFPSEVEGPKDNDENQIQSTSSTVHDNSGNYLKRCTLEAQEAIAPFIKGVKADEGDLSKFAYRDNSNSGLKSDQPELVSPPRKMHKVMNSDSVCSQPFQPPSTGSKRRNMFTRKAPKNTVGLKFTQYLFEKK